MLSASERAGLRVQEAVSQGLILLTYFCLAGWMRARGYRIPGLRERRAEFEAARGPGRGPLLICANHLTLIDSLIILWAMGLAWRFFRHPGLFAWNLPDKHNMSRNVLLRLLGYVGKCMPVLREGPPETARRTLEKAAYLLARGQSVMVFPEGGRSRIGRVDRDRVTYGVGRMLQEVPSTRVLCVYMRGRGQVEYSNYPRRGETFYIRFARLSPTTSSQGMRGARDLSNAIIEQLIQMENRYFENATVDR